VSRDGRETVRGVWGGGVGGGAFVWVVVLVGWEQRVVGVGEGGGGGGVKKWEWCGEMGEGGGGCAVVRTRGCSG